jgi:hypothetical protein
VTSDCFTAFFFRSIRSMTGPPVRLLVSDRVLTKPLRSFNLHAVNTKPFAMPSDITCMFKHSFSRDLPHTKALTLNF